MSACESHGDTALLAYCGATTVSVQPHGVGCAERPERSDRRAAADDDEDAANHADNDGDGDGDGGGDDS